MRERVYKALCESGLPVAHMAFKRGKAPELPWCVYYEGTSDDLHADGRNYAKVRTFYVELYQKNPSEEVEGRLEKAISDSFGAWSKEEEFWVDDEDCAETVYTFTVIERNDDN